MGTLHRRLILRVAGGIYMYIPCSEGKPHTGKGGVKVDDRDYNVKSGDVGEKETEASEE